MNRWFPGPFSRARAARPLLLICALAACGGETAKGDDDPRPPVPPGDPGDDDPNPGGEDPTGMMVQIDDVSTPTKSRGTALGGNATGVNGCTDLDPADHYEQPPVEGAPQLHLVSAAVPLGSEEPGDITLHVNRPGNSVLVLSVAWPATWHVTAAPGATIERVIVRSYRARSVSAVVPDGIPVEIYTYEEHGDILGPFGHDWPGLRTTAFVDAAEEHTGLVLTSFRGCWESSLFQIDEPGDLAPPHPVSEATEPRILAGCGAIATESRYCMATTSGNLVMLGLDSGTVCHGEPASPWMYAPASSLGWRGDYVYLCDSTRGIGRISIVDGTVDVAPVPCESITAFEDGLLGMVSVEGGWSSTGLGYLAHFATFEQVAERRPTRAFAIDAWATRIAMHGDQVYFAWHSTDTVETARLKDDAPIYPVPLEGYNDWIWAMDATDDGRLVIGGPPLSVPHHPSVGGIRLFDAATGDSLGELPSEFDDLQINGMQCISRP
jgi:hypothetical protein